MLITKHTAADGGREKIPVTFLSGRAAFSAIPVFMNIKVITINGNSDGRTHSAHSAKPLKQLVM